MRQVQEALANIGIPVMAGVWRATSPNQNPPAQYAVYSSTTTESSHADDFCTSYRTYVYLNLWSNTDPTEMASTIRQAMYRYGFTMLEESDKGYSARRSPLKIRGTRERRNALGELIIRSVE